MGGTHKQTDTPMCKPLIDQTALEAILVKIIDSSFLFRVERCRRNNLNKILIIVSLVVMASTFWKLKCPSFKTFYFGHHGFPTFFWHGFVQITRKKMCKGHMPPYMPHRFILGFEQDTGYRIVCSQTGQQGSSPQICTVRQCVT